MNRTRRHPALKFGAFAAIMIALSVCLFYIFGQYRNGSTTGYSAVFGDVSSLKSGDSVRVAGIRVGTVRKVHLQPNKAVLVNFDVDDTVRLTAGTKTTVRYLNLVGDRYLDLVNEPGSTRILPPGSQIPQQRTAPALDLDLLLGGLKPVIQGLNAQDVNALTASLIQVMQGQDGNLQSLFAKTSSFTNTLGSNNQTVQALIDNLNTVMETLSRNGSQFSGAIDRIQRLVTGLADDRDSIGGAIEALDRGAASMTDLLGHARAPIRSSIDQLNRLAPLLDQDKDRIDAAIQRSPENYRKLIRLGAYGSFLNYYICSLDFRVSDLQGRTAVFPWIKQDGGRCAER